VLAFRRIVSVQFQLQDGLALVVGYGMAALFFRAFWPSSHPSPALGVPGVAFYLWLGLAMSGPIILFRRGPRQPEPPEPPGTPVPVGSRTWAELAWLLIGIYWIVLGSIAIPARLQSFKLSDTLLFGLVPFVVTIGFRFVGPRSTPSAGANSPWSHRTAIALLSTWPIAWICLIILGRTLQ
jgi:hypothetical protein